MFWNLVLEPGKQYSSTVSESFHLSMATLDVKSVKDAKDIFPVLLEIDGQKIVLCNLNKSQFLQVNLDHVFEKGTKVSFFTTGNATIHLTGYLVNDEGSESEDYSDLSDLDSESFEKVHSKLDKKGQGETNANLQKKTKRKLESIDEVSKKKSKAQFDNSDDDDDDDDDDDGDGDEDEDSHTLNALDSGDSYEEDDDDDSDDNDDDDDDDDDDSDADTDIESETEDNKNAKPKNSPTKTPQQTPKKKQNEKTPGSNKKQGKQNQSVTNGTTPKLDKKDGNKGTPLQQGKQQGGTPLQQGKQQGGTPQQGKQQGKQQGGTPQQGKQGGTPPQQGKQQGGTPQKRSLTGGVVVEDLKTTNGGPTAKQGKMLAVYYTGRLKSNNRVFDQTNNGPGFKFRLGRGEVIKGWDVGLAGMTVGSKRRITCPANMAYGSKGSPPTVPANATLVFDVELKSVN